MTEDPSPDMEVLVRDAWASAERLAVEVIGYPPPLRDEALRQMGEAFAEAMQAAGASDAVAREFGVQMEQTIRAFVSDIVAGDGRG